MVSRTPRHQSQPRSTRSRPSQSFESWENVNDNIRPAPSAMSHHNHHPSMERRAASAMRHQSTPRGGGMMTNPLPGGATRSARRLDTPSKLPTTVSTTPRPVSAGRIRAFQPAPDDDDPNSVTRQILDLRERRESSSLHRRKSLVNESPMKSRTPHSNNALVNSATAAALTYSKSNVSEPQSPKGRILKQSASNMSQEEIMAEERLKRAENKISGLLDELEELKFFQELESEVPTPRNALATTSSSSNTPRHHTQPQPSQSFAQTPRSRELTTPANTAAVDRAMSRGRERAASTGGGAGAGAGGDPSRTAGIPLNIRTVSPARTGRLPPPPPANLNPAQTPRLKAQPHTLGHSSVNGGGGGLETYKPLSPRAIAKLDRNSLELECQTLVRKLQIIEQEKNSQTAMIEMYEVSLQDHDNDKAKIAKLQGELGKVSAELKRQLQSITKGKESLIKDYEEKLQSNLTKLHRISEKADSYKMEMESSQQEARRYKEELESMKSKVQGESTRAEDLRAREKVLELQLQEARNLNATLVQKVEKKRAEVTTLQNTLSQTSQELRETKMERDQDYESKISTLQQEVSAAQDKYTRLEQEFLDRDELATQQEKKLDLAQVKEAEHMALIEELRARVNDLEKETVAKFEEGKKANKTQETRKMQELVAERANQTKEYERRIKAMQEQLRHQADRHHAEVKETRRRNDERLEAMRDEIREEIRLQEGEKIVKLETELSVLRRTYEESKEDYATRLREAQQKSRDAAADFQQQDEARQQELDHLHTRLEGYLKDLTEKQADLTDMGKRLEETRNALDEAEAAKSRALAETERKNAQLEEEREQATNKELEFDARLDAIKADFNSLEDRLRTENEELQGEIDSVHKQLSEAQVAAKENEITKKRLEEVQNSLDSLEMTLQKERTRHEEEESELRVELAKLEGRLRASESSLKTKKSRVQELEAQLDKATMTSSKVGEEKQMEIVSLRRQLEELTTKFDTEHSTVQEKDGVITKLRGEITRLQEKVETLNELEESIRDLKRKASQVEYDNSKKDAELAKVTKTYEETRSKLLEAEQRYTTVKADLATQIEKKENLIQRYDKSIKDLESSLEKERKTSADLESSIAELKRNSEALESERIRKDTELTNLRKDYEDLSGLLEENLHSSAKKDELDLQLKRREREMRETVDIYNQNVVDLEEKLKKAEKAKEESEAKVKELQTTLEEAADEKRKLRYEVTSLKQKCDNASFELSNFQKEKEESKGGIEAELGRKDRHMRETIQRYTRTIADLEAKLEEELQAKSELEDRLGSARSELEDKQKQTQELIQKHTKATLTLESDLSKATFEKEELKTRLDQTNKDLEKKRKELMQTVAKYSSEMSELESVKHEHDEFRQLSQSAQEELDLKTKQINELKKKVPELLTELQAKSRECDEHKAAAKRLEAELNKRKEQYNEAVSRYTGQIAELKSELDEHSVARSTTEGQVESVKAEATRKENKIRDLQTTIGELESKLEIANKNKELAKQKADTVARDLDEKEGELRKFEMENIELQTKLHTQTRLKDELRGKVSDLSSKLERKEREVREVSDRYSMYVMELESKLDQDTDAKHQMQRDIDRLKSNLSSVADVSNEASELREKVYNLEKTVESYRGKARDAEYKSKDAVRLLEDRLAEANKAKGDIENSLKKVQGEKAEVIAALEGVINEVQNREDEIESLSDLLQRRDEELQHAKIIATKALQSAKDLQKRYKDQDKHMQSDMMGRVDELSDNVDKLTSTNETLQRKISMLERDLRDKNLECKRLKDQLRQIDGNGLRDNRDPVKDDGSAFTQSTFGSSREDRFPNPASSGSLNSRGLRIDPGNTMDPDGIGMSTDSFSPSGSSGHASPVGGFEGENDMFSKEVEFSRFSTGRQTNAYHDDGGASTIVTSDVTDRWTQDFDTDSRGGFDSISSEPVGRSRQSIERDALRKYVRQRYMAKR